MPAVADILVLGAGPAGLGAAYRAARTGRRVVVVERADRCGGAAGSFEVAGVRVDFGSHRLHPATDPEILAELRGLLGESLQLRRRRGRIRLAGRWIDFPLRVGDLVRRLPPGFAARAALDAASAPLRRPRHDTFAEHLRAGLGPTMCRSFYFPYARKLWGLEPEEISAEQARRRVTADSPVKILRRVLRGGAEQGQVFYYPRRGYGQLWEKLAQAATNHGAEIHLRISADRIELGARGVRVHTPQGAIEGDRVWSTIPVTALARMTDPPPPPDVLAAAENLHSRAMVLVYLVLPVGRYTPFDAHYLPGAETPVTRISEPKNYRDGPDPSDVTVLCAEIPCAAGDDIWRSDDEALGELVTGTLVGLGLPRAEPVGLEVRRLPSAYPVYRVGFEEHLARLDAWASSQERLLTFGRQGLFVHDNSHHALAMAWAATDSLGHGGFDEGAWAAARSRFASHVVED